VRGAGRDIPFALESLKRRPHRRPAYTKALSDFGFDDASARSELAAYDQIPQ